MPTVSHYEIDLLNNKMLQYIFIKAFFNKYMLIIGR